MYENLSSRYKCSFQLLWGICSKWVRR